MCVNHTLSVNVGSNGRAHQTQITFATQLDTLGRSGAARLLACVYYMQVAIA